MKYSKASIIQTAIISAALFITGLLVFEKLFNFFEPRVTGVIFHVTEVGGKVSTSLLFALALALIPVFLLMVWQLTPIVTVNKKLLSVLIVFVLMVVAIWIRQRSVKSYYTSLSKNPALANFSNGQQYPIDPVNLVYYMFLGLCIGSMLCYFLFRPRKKRI